jgi:hypothetical protein
MLLAKLEAVISSFQRVRPVWFEIKQAVCTHVVVTNLPPGVLDSTGSLRLCRFDIAPRHIAFDKVAGLQGAQSVVETNRLCLIVGALLVQVTLFFTFSFTDRECLIEGYVPLEEALLR